MLHQIRLLQGNNDYSDYLPLIWKYERIKSETQFQEHSEGPDIAALIYGDEESKSMLEEAVRVVILMIVFVFDPLAVLMVMAASREMKKNKGDNEEIT